MHAREPIGSEAGPGVVDTFAIVIRVAFVVGLLGAFASVGTAADPPPPVLSQAPVAVPPSPPAGNTQPSAPVSFVIEKITVEGVRGGSTKIVVSETLLNPGSAYTEAQLREALQRVERLPFVVEAEFSLRRGSERGRYELVITVAQTWPVFFGGTLDLTRRGSAYELSEGFWEGGAVIEGGVRAFLGGQSEVTGTLQLVSPLTEWYGAEQDSNFAFDLAYRHHDLFGRHLVGTLFLREPVSLGSPDREAGASLAVPLSRVSALNLDLDVGWTRWRACAEPCASLGELRVTQYEGGAAWRRDTTDDPFAPQEGSRLEAGLSYSWSSARYVWDYDPASPPPDPATPGVTTVRTQTGGGVHSVLAGRRYWSVARWAALGVGGTVTLDRSWGDASESRGEDVWTGTVRSSGLLSTVEAELVGRPRAIGRGTTQLWWVARASARGVGYRTETDPPPENVPGWMEARFGWGRLSVGLAARGRWGIARLELSYEYAFREHTEFR